MPKIQQNFKIYIFYLTKSYKYLYTFSKELIKIEVYYER